LKSFTSFTARRIKREFRKRLNTPRPLADKARVERRKELRLKARQPVTLTVLGAQASYLIEGCVLDMSGSGLQLRVPMPVACGTPVKIDGKNTLMLGEVCRCEPEEGAYTVGVQLSQTLAEPKVESDSEPRISGR